MGVLQRIGKGVLGAFRTILKVLAWLLLITGVCAFGLMLVSPLDTAKLFDQFIVFWMVLLLPAIMVALIASIFPKARYSPVLTTVTTASIAVAFYTIFYYWVFTVDSSGAP